MSLYTEKIETKVLFFVASQSVSITVHHLLPMHRLFIPPIPLGKISLAAHYPEAVLQSIATQLCLCHFDVSHKIHLCLFIYIRPFMASLIEAYITKQELDEIIVLNRNSLWVWQIVNNQKFPWSFLGHHSYWWHLISGENGCKKQLESYLLGALSLCNPVPHADVHLWI